MSDVETINDSMICSRELKVGSLVPLYIDTKQKAYRAAAWIIILAECVNELPDEAEPSTFEEILEAIRKT